MSAAEREAKARYGHLPSGFDRAASSAFVAGTEWQAGRAEAEFRARFPNGEVVGESRINAGAAVNALYEAHAEYPFVIEDERIVVEKRTVGPWEVTGDE